MKIATNRQTSATPGTGKGIPTKIPTRNDTSAAVQQQAGIVLVSRQDSASPQRLETFRPTDEPQTASARAGYDQVQLAPAAPRYDLPSPTPTVAAAPAMPETPEGAIGQAADADFGLELTTRADQDKIKKTKAQAESATTGEPQAAPAGPDVNPAPRRDYVQPEKYAPSLTPEAAAGAASLNASDEGPDIHLRDKTTQARTVQTNQPQRASDFPWWVLLLLGLG